MIGVSSKAFISPIGIRNPYGSWVAVELMTRVSYLRGEVDMGLELCPHCLGSSICYRFWIYKLLRSMICQLI